ncbi:hypothetical protein [Streptomyces sp. NPDC127112]|uniref:hypothetical protein n=1 Tax=Streptomyces sp. NPDC127112 TaxID=3345364 RepID=UPI0036449075
MPEGTIPETWTLMSKTRRGSFCFGGDFPVAPVEVNGLTSAPELFTNYQRLITRDGMWKGTQYLGGRSITLSMNILAAGDAHVNNVINELNWAFPIGYGTDQEEIELHFTIPGVANGGAAKIKGMVQKRDIKLDAMYAQQGAPRIDIEVYCHNPEFSGYGEARARMDTAAGFSAGGALCPFEFGDKGLFFPANFEGGQEIKTLITNNAKDRDDKSCPSGPVWKSEIHGPISTPNLVRRNYFEDIWKIQLDKDIRVFEGQTLLYEPDPFMPPQDGCVINGKPVDIKWTGKVHLAVNGGIIERDLPHRTTFTARGTTDEKPDPLGGAWGLIGSLRQGDEISTSEFWSIVPGISDRPIDGNAYGFVTWSGGKFI